MYYKCIELDWNILPIQWSTLLIHPNALKKDSNTLVSFKIHLSTIKMHSYILIYILIPSKYITIPSKNLTYFWHILQYHYYTPISFRIRWNWPITSLFCTSLSCHYTIFQNCLGVLLFYQNVLHLPWHVYYNPKMKHILWISYILLVK
jgi:hypothetical protein